jgi:hypothetical protein
LHGLTRALWVVAALSTAMVSLAAAQGTPPPAPGMPVPAPGHPAEKWPDPIIIDFPKPPPSPSGWLKWFVIIAVALGILVLAYLYWKKKVKSRRCAPKIIRFEAKPGRVQVNDFRLPGKDLHCWLCCGVPGIAEGITFIAEVELPAGCSGTLEFVQNVKPMVRVSPGVKDRANPSECIDAKAKWYLDVSDPYLGRSFPIGSGVTVISETDSPCVCLSDIPVEQAETIQDFRMFLMWRPNLPQARREAVAEIVWSWFGTAQASDEKQKDCAHVYPNLKVTNYWRLDRQEPFGISATTQIPPAHTPVFTPNVNDIMDQWEKC